MTKLPQKTNNQPNEGSEFYNPNDKRIIKKDNVRYQVIKYDHFNMSET